MKKIINYNLISGLLSTFILTIPIHSVWATKGGSESEDISFPIPTRPVPIAEKGKERISSVNYPPEVKQTYRPEVSGLLLQPPEELFKQTPQGEYLGILQDYLKGTPIKAGKKVKGTEKESLKIVFGENIPGETLIKGTEKDPQEEWIFRGEIKKRK